MYHGRRFACLGIGGRFGREFRRKVAFEDSKGEEVRTLVASQRIHDPAPKSAAVAIVCRQSWLLCRMCYVGSNETS
jgi:hypothetical protein